MAPNRKQTRRALTARSGFGRRLFSLLLVSCCLPVLSLLVLLLFLFLLLEPVTPTWHGLEKERRRFDHLALVLRNIKINGISFAECGEES